MKKLVVTILAVFYLGVSSGATVHFHYCMGELFEWGLSKNKAANCDNCSMKKAAAQDCCKDQHQQFKVEKSQKASQTLFQFNQPSLDIPILSYQIVSEQFTGISAQGHPYGNAPPRTNQIPVFIRNCTYLI
ncbi:HYC_CC_PP family protein [Daejeonella oryzae]|uniref:HYC_CC_PP family protein n=1 Tax=Daejeonella oryzae TaxID=1122943 RepID=UPI00047A4FED|nr:hypothetical protein [Daejeonella oryzae]